MRQLWRFLMVVMAGCVLLPAMCGQAAGAAGASRAPAPAAASPARPAGAARQPQSGAPAAEPAKRLQEGKRLLAQGDAYAQAGRLAEALDAWKRGYEALFPAFRGIAFRKPVAVEYLDRTGVRARILEILASECPDEEIRAEQKALAAFGFVASDLDLKETLVRLHTEEVAGFYDPARKRLYLVRDARSGGPRTPGASAAGPLNADGDKMVLLHEMAHALMDQHHNLEAMERAARKNDDRMLALSALIEGEATLAMLVGTDPDRGSFFLGLPPGLMDVAFTLLRPFLGFASGESFRNAPPILRERLLFPYMKGLPFCLALSRPSRAWRPVDAAFARPPLSTEQILHPEKYPKELPVALSLPDIQPDLPEGWAPVYANTMGELQTQVLLSEAIPGVESLRAAEGWAGDAYRVYERTGGPDDLPRSLYVWVSTWDTQADAREFRETMVRALAARTQMEPLDITEVPALPQGMWGKAWLSRESLTAVLARGSDVWVLCRIPETAVPAVLARLLEARRAPGGAQTPQPKPAR